MTTDKGIVLQDSNQDVNFREFALEVLSTIELPKSTISRLRIDLDRGDTQIVVQGRISITNCQRLGHIKNINGRFSGIELQVDGNTVKAHDTVTHSKTEFKTSELHANLSFLRPAILGPLIGRQTTKTSTLMEVSSTFVNQLTSNSDASTSELDAIEFLVLIQQLGMAGYFRKKLDLQDGDQPETYENIQAETIDNRVALQAALFGSEPKFKLALTGNPELLAQLAHEILNFDYGQVLPDALGPLFMKLIPGESKSPIWGHVTSRENVRSLLLPLIKEISSKTLSEVSDSELSREVHANKIANLKFLDPTDSPGSFLSATIQMIQEAFAEFFEEKEESAFELKIENFASIVSNKNAAMVARHCIWFAFLKNYSLKRESLSYEFMSKSWEACNVKVGNQLEMDWGASFSNSGPDYIFGAPKFTGVQKQTEEERNQLSRVFGKRVAVDFSAGWLKKASKLVEQGSVDCAFVLTNSVCQGSQVGRIWPEILDGEIYISFARQAFKWLNGGGVNTGVTVVIVGLSRSKSIAVKANLFDSSNNKLEVPLIGPYLVPNTIDIIHECSRPLSEQLPKMVKGNMPYGESLVLDTHEADELIAENPDIGRYVKQLVGSEELMRSQPRRCLWIPDALSDSACEIEKIRERVNAVRLQREKSVDEAGRKLAESPHRFRETNETMRQTLVVPAVSSETRKYIPMAFVGPETIVSNLAFAVYESPTWLLSLLSSSAHQIWAKTFSGGLETRIRYSNRGVYNTFPCPQLSEKNIDDLETMALKLIRTRARYFELALGDLYNAIPLDLQAVHNEIDRFVLGLFNIDEFADDDEILNSMIEKSLAMRGKSADHRKGKI